MEQEIKDIIEQAKKELIESIGIEVSEEFESKTAKVFGEAIEEALNGEYNKLCRAFVEQLKEAEQEIGHIKTQVDTIRELLNFIGDK
ncbi:hypothetical protein [Pseudoalteromonas sp. JC3]|uniref:hypothetical protein n=1 Tax=Pseudoalteromonas sp. JC3 TaxID=2810196 RepID=UPI0019D133B9|nr:hypothetical protein [Pseudoalteromonas sp. JC3]MBR8841675.1 hypothetical protein [Pseudoalteromonas sp. JC3]WJE07700.1 hypothetical protein QSH61_12445 [Pseudoalteromonas sp. JC3]